MQCECCKVHISTGSQVVMLHGRPWLPKHAQAYQAARRGRRAVTG